MKKFSKSIILILTLMLAMSFSFAVSAEDGEVANDSDWKYELLEDGSAKIIKYSGKESTVNIPSEFGDTVVTTLGNDVFRGNDNVKEVIIPDGISTIESTFYMTNNIETIKISATVDNINKRAFYCCWGLKNIVVSEDNEYYASVDGVLYDKSLNRLINVPANKHMDSFKIPDGVEVIGELSIRCQDIKEIVIPDTVTKIESYSIYTNGLTKLTIPGSVKTLEDDAIYYCNDLESIKIEEGNLKEISTMAINTCYNLKRIELPSNITSIGFFYDCNALNEIIISEKNKNYCVEDGVVLNKVQTKIVLYPRGSEKTSYTVPEGVTVIGENSFYGAKNLTDIYMPDSVKVIEPFAFAYCSGLTTVYYDGTKEQFEAIDIDEETVFFSNVVFPEPHIHSYDTVKVIKKATNKANGKVEYICSCGESYKETVYELDSVKLSTSKCTYNGKKRTPSVIAKDSKGNTLKKDVDYTVKYESGRKMPGRYKITVTFKGKYEYKKEFDFVIMPKTPTLKVTTTKGKATLSYTDLAGVTGYQIYYSTDGKTYKKLVTTSKEKYSKTLKSGKKYYFKVRGYVKPASGNTVYGSFSSAKSVKIA